MVKRLDQTDRGILTFRPNIAFVEPDAQDGVIDAVEERLPFEDVQDGRQQLKQFAKAVNVMAAAIQARADERAKNLVIKLDRNVDADTCQAMLRKFPDAPCDEITYDQYRQVKADIRDKGIAVGRQGIIQPDEVQKARDELNTFIPGGFGTDLANNGGLRPELDERATIIPAVNVEEVQISLICILVNFIWKNFIKIIIPLPGLPDKLCDPGADIEIPGLFILGDPASDLLTGKVADQASEEAGI